MAETMLGGNALPLHIAGILRAVECNGALNPVFIIADAAPA